MKTRYIEEEQTGENGLQPTTWAYCWRCGKKISYAHANECWSGVHKDCETPKEFQYTASQLLEIQLGM